MDERPDLLLDHVARRQHGAFNRSQTLAVGFTDTMVRRRLAGGRWIRLDDGVYALASHPFTWRRQCMAATLTTPGSAIAGNSAAVLHGLPPFRAGGVELLVPRVARSTRTPLARVRSASCFRSTTVDGVPCLTVADTVMSLLPHATMLELEAAIDGALVGRLTTIDELHDRFVARVPLRARGRGGLRELLAARDTGGYAPPTSQLERQLRKMLLRDHADRFGFEQSPWWWPNGEGRVDAYCAESRLIVEADGRRWHTREADFVRDRQRDNLAVSHGHVVLRFTYLDLRHHSDECRTIVGRTISTRTSHVS